MFRRVVVSLLLALPLVAQSTSRNVVFRPSGVVLKNVAMAVDQTSGAVTFTFRHAAGEPEVRLPVAALGLPSDWRPWKGLVFDFHATSLEAFTLGFTDGTVTKGVVMEPLAGVRIRAGIPFDTFTQTRTMTPLLPLGFKAWPLRLFTFERVTEVILKMKQPAADSQITLYNMRLSNDPLPDDILDRRPLVDRYGQWIPEHWPGKAHSDGELRALWERDTLPPQDYPFCELGGDRSKTLKATGFFRTEQIDGRWYFVDPHGHPFFSTGMDLVGWRQGSFATRVTGREFLFEELPPAGAAWLTPGKDVSFHIANVMKRHGAEWQPVWERRIIERLKNWGFNTVANWSDREIAVAGGMPYVLPLSGWTTKRTFPFPWDFPDVFSKEFEQNVDEAARKQVAASRDDARVLGWFIGNEPHWAREFGSLKPWADMLLEDPEPSATKAELQRRVAADPTNAKRIKDEWVYTCGRKYFETIVAALRKHDPNHLILGIRYAGTPDEQWIEMSKMFDVFSINIYSETYRPEPAAIDRYARISGKPVLIGEFTAAAPGRGLQGLFYWVHKVRDQAERGVAYRYYVEQAAAHPAIIGTHWFQLVDDLPTGRPSDEERLNYGFLNVLDLPYQELVDAARETHRRIYEVKSGKVSSFQQKPEAQ